MGNIYSFLKVKTKQSNNYRKLHVVITTMNHKIYLIISLNKKYFYFPDIITYKTLIIYM
jgi:hypothetical protein